MALCCAVAGEGGLQLARAILTALSVMLCAQLMRFASVVVGAERRRAAAIATGWVFALHLPLVPYAHVVLSETLYLCVLLPGLTLLARSGGRGSMLLFAGLWIGASALVRESSLVLLVCLLPWVALVPRTRGRDGLRAAALFAAGAAVAITPWTARNLFAYGKVIPVSITSGTNAFLGLNARYINFDLPRLADHNPADVPGHALRARLLDSEGAPDGWAQSDRVGVAARDGENLARGLQFAAENPGYLARTRVVKLSDQFTPLSYVVKYLRLGDYEAPLDSRVARVGLGWAAVLQEVLLWLVVVLAIASVRLVPGAGSLFAVTSIGLSLPAFAVAMSRFRAPLEALLLALAAAWLAGARTRPTARRIGAAGLVAVTLAFLWYVALPPTVASLRALGAEVPR